MGSDTQHHCCTPNSPSGTREALSRCSRPRLPRRTGPSQDHRRSHCTTMYQRDTHTPICRARPGRNSPQAGTRLASGTRRSPQSHRTPPVGRSGPRLCSQSCTRGPRDSPRHQAPSPGHRFGTNSNAEPSTSYNSRSPRREASRVPRSNAGSCPLLPCATSDLGSQLSCPGKHPVNFVEIGGSRVPRRAIRSTRDQVLSISICVPDGYGVRFGVFVDGP